MLDIAFVNETNDDITGYEELITDVFNETMIQEKNDNFYEVGVIFVTKDKIQEINKTYRKIDKVTDVISFALFDETEDIIQDESIITTLGDIFICLDQMKEQAVTYVHSEQRELAFLACHGLLHLLGYDHDNTNDEDIMFKEHEEIMFKKQENILNKLNIKRN